MGIQDRDYYKEHWKERRAEEERAAKRPWWTQKSPSQRTNGPPHLIGSNWHWSLQLLVWLCIAVIMLIGWRLIR